MKPARLLNGRRKLFRRLLPAVILLVAIVIVPYGWSRIASPWRRVSVQTHRVSPASESVGEPFRVACFNMAHGRGLANSNWKGGSREDRKKRLDQIADLLKELDADVVILNEVDFDSSWSFSVNQARYLAERAGYSYWAEQRNLDLRVVAWKWRFGNALLSRYPIVGASVIELPDYSSIETLLAGKKRVLNCTMRLHDQRVRVVAVHLCQRSEANRARSADMITKLASSDEVMTIVAGDFNSTPSGFPNTESDATWGNAIDRFDASALFQRYPKRPSNSLDQFTFHSTHPITTIDWILIPKQSRMLEYRVVPTTLSDHRPVVAELSLPTDEPLGD